MSPTPEARLLTVAQMGEADRLTIEGGISGDRLMAAAGRGVADVIRRRWSPRPVLVLAGPGNNGGDGFAAAARLRAAGWSVTVALLGDRGKLTGDAAGHAQRWHGPLVPLEEAAPPAGGLVIDALFGAGLSRPVTGSVAGLLDKMRESALPVVAVDVPSGVDGDTGRIRGAAIPADVTVTFFRAKPGHLLLPGREGCGDVEVIDIGIPEAVLDAPSLNEQGPTLWRNDPRLWRARLTWPRPGDHKYARGAVLVVAGPRMTGAARLAALGARRAGAGIVFVWARPETRAEIVSDQPGLIVESHLGVEGHDGDRHASALAERLSGHRRETVVIGPGLGREAQERRLRDQALASAQPLVLDADALPQDSPDRESFIAACRDRDSAATIATPHEGEFARLFPDLAEKAEDAARRGKAERALEGARRLGVPVLLKGYDTVIAHPDGRAVINASAPPTLAVAGAGDVLAGLIAALMAQGWPAFEAAAAAAHIHGEAAQRLGFGLLAEELPREAGRGMAALMNPADERPGDAPG